MSAPLALTRSFSSPRRSTLPALLATLGALSVTVPALAQRAMPRAPAGSGGWLLFALQVLAGWALTMVVVLGIGLALSALTTRAARHASSRGRARASWPERALRRVYAWTLGLSCALFYVSLPLIAVVVLGIGAGLVYLSIALGRIPVDLLLLVSGLVLATLWAVGRSMLVLLDRPREREPGLRLAPGAAPRLRALIREVAARVGTRPVDTVFLSPFAEVAVFERGSLVAQARDRAERCLVLGVGVLEGLDVRALAAILAHEHGHFANRDTAGGHFALAARRSIGAMTLSMLESRAASWVNPAWLFLTAFQRVFLRLSQGASRLSEVLADRWAVLAFGAPALERGLRHVIRREIELGAHVDHVIARALASGTTIRTVYDEASERTPEERRAIELETARCIAREAHAWDSHPSPLERFELAHALGAETEASELDSVPAWSLLDDREDVESRMTDRVAQEVWRATGKRILEVRF